MHCRNGRRTGRLGDFIQNVSLSRLLQRARWDDGVWIARRRATASRVARVMSAPDAASVQPATRAPTVSKTSTSARRGRRVTQIRTAPTASAHSCASVAPATRGLPTRRVWVGH